MNIYFPDDSIHSDAFDAMKNIVKVLFSEHTFHDMPKEKKLDDISPKIDLLFQYISENDFDEAAQNRFKCSGEDRKAGHPLCYRYPYNDDKENYSAYCFPILYITEFALAEKDEADIAFLDSSIWHRALWIEDPSFVVKLSERLKDFPHWHDQKLYNRLVSIEILDYHIRMLQEQRLPFKEGHAFVHLCSWSSETQRNNEAKEKPVPLPRRFLLVDDYAATELRKFCSCSNSGTTTFDTITVPERIENEEQIKKYSKTDVVWQALKQIYGEEEIGQIELDYVTKIEEGKSNLELEQYDVILLDYLLGRAADQRGSELIRNIARRVEESQQEESRQEEKGQEPPLLGKFWIFSISAFPSAFQAEIASGKLQPFEKSYCLHPGADPVTTPALFKRCLHDFLKYQENEACVESSNIYKIYLKKMSELSKATKDPQLDKIARDTYQDLVSMINTVDMLRKAEKYSLFAKKSLDRHPIHRDKDLMEDFHYLIFRIAHETLRTWDKMWDEFLTVKAKLEQYDRETDLTLIRNYIIKLQKRACR